VSPLAATPFDGTLLLIRHGIAEDPRPGQADADRPLTEEGWQRTRRAMRGLLRAGWAPDAAVASPYRRAAETLACLQEAVLESGRQALRTESWEGLAPEGDPGAAEAFLLRRLRSVGPGSTLAVVSHQPFLGELVFRLTGDSLEIRKASCTVVARAAAGWRLLAHLRPSELRAQA